MFNALDQSVCCLSVQFLNSYKQILIISLQIKYQLINFVMIRIIIWKGSLVHIILSTLVVQSGYLASMRDCAILKIIQEVHTVQKEMITINAVKSFWYKILMI